MERRTFLTGLCLTTVALGGCVNVEDDDQNELEVDDRCDGYVLVSSLPEPVDGEVTTAIEDGEYETEGDLLLPEVIEVDSTSLVYDDSSDVARYFEPEVETDGSRTRLVLEELFPEVDAVEVRNRTEEGVTVEVRLEHEGDLLVEEELSIEPGRTVPLEEDVEYRYGTYRAEITAPEAELTDEVQTWTVNEFRSQALINVNRGETFLGQSVDEAVYCEPTAE